MKIRGQFWAKLAARCLVLVARLLFATCRVEYRFFRPGHNAYDPNIEERFFYSIWHGSLLMPMFVSRARHMGVLVSHHDDGALLSAGLRLRDVVTVRGSTSRGGSSAVRKMMNSAADKHITITPDGPRGPHQKMKDGIVYLASQTGKAIVPMAYTCDRAWRARGRWTATVIPKPFSKIYVLSDQEIHVPPDLSRESLSHFSQVVQQAMDRINHLAERVAAGDDISNSAENISNSTEPKAAA